MLWLHKGLIVYLEQNYKLFKSKWLHLYLPQRCKHRVDRLMFVCLWSDVKHPPPPPLIHWVWGKNKEWKFGVWTRNLWNLWLSVLPSFHKAAEQWSELSDPSVLMLTSPWFHSLLPLCLKNTPVHWAANLIFLPLICFIIVVTWASWYNCRAEHCLCLQLAYLL